MDREHQPVLSAPEILSRVHSLISQAATGPVDEEDFSRLALALFAFQFEKVLIYRRLCESRGVSPDSIQHWSRIPALPTSAFKEYVVSSLPEEARTHEFRSSGTTGQAPSRHFHSAASLSLYEASLLPWFERHFPAAGAFFVFLTPPSTQAAHSSLVYMFDAVRQKFGGTDALFGGEVEIDGSWRLDFDRIGSAVREAVSAKRPVALLGTAFSFVHWLDHLAVNKVQIRLPAGSRIMETGGYKGRSRVVAKSELRRLMTKYLGVPESQIVTEYGMCELGSQAYDNAQDRVFHFPPWARTQIVSPETGAILPAGETGLLRIFDLANMYSVMAIQTEDLAVSRGDGFELLGRAESAAPRGCSLMAAP
jgi:hypothetical protein